MIHLKCTGKRFERTESKLERIEVLVYDVAEAVPIFIGTVWLTLTEAKLLMVLGLRIGDVFRISSYDRNISQDSIRVHISRINKKLEAIGLGKLIICTKRFEYCLAVSSCNFYPLFISAIESIHDDDLELIETHLVKPLALLTGLEGQKCCPNCGCDLG